LQEEQLSEKLKSASCFTISDAKFRNTSVPFVSWVNAEYKYIVFKFNAFFQSEETKVHLLQSAAKNLLKTVLKNVVKAPLLNFVSMGIINPLLACNRLSPDQVMVGEAKIFLIDWIKKVREIVKLIYNNCLAFYDIAAKEICNKLFVKDKFLSKLRIIKPKFAL